MTIPPWQLGLRSLMELMSLIGIGAGAHRLLEGRPFDGVATIGLPAIAAAVWVTFAVKGDPSRSGKAPVTVPGPVRLALELVVFGAGALGLALAQWYLSFAVFVGAFVVHHRGTRERIAWLLRQ